MKENIRFNLKRMKFYFRLFIKLLIISIIIYVYSSIDSFIQIFEYITYIKRLITKPKCVFSYDVPIPESVLKTGVSTIKACIFILLRNKDLCDLINTMIQFEKNFNKKHRYPYVLVSDQVLSAEFKRTIYKYTDSKIEFGLIPKHEWSVPDWIDRTKLKQSINKIGKNEGYRHLCRYYSGFFFKHELTLKYDYYMRLDPHVNFPCQVNEDPFETLIKLNKSYGFVIAVPEARFTIPTLWDHIKKWRETNLDTGDDHGLDYISNDNGQTLSDKNCIFYNNFEIGAFSLFRDQKYLDFFNTLDKTGGFYHERWVNTNFFTVKVNFLVIYLSTFRSTK